MSGKLSKQLIGIRVDLETFNALKKLLAADGVRSLSEYGERVLRAHVARQQSGKGGGEWLSELEQQMSERSARDREHQQREHEAHTKRIERQIDAVKGMVDALATVLTGKDYELYVKTVKQTLQAMNIQVSRNGSNASGAGHE
jgi:hypothetical protein